MQVFQVRGVRCGGCASKIVDRIKAADPSAMVEIDISAGKLTVESGLVADALIHIIGEAGYPATPHA
ncbi:hypothetical protein SDC9_183781 [bioreactor metagenome]|uniref:Copper resistance protein CopZ n=2 Tax=root TaxID=1 RepID=A0A323UZE8_9RHOO|nr:heavy-metal-associated domain-containing protein [Parazoarcus communis]NMG50565.1 copper resistance protein CopZ [Parazoarcus communis]NMG71154.1 copper resistance protein CopZ [Parazoarcus communis SWub3 = DSM 12120]PZA17080.1 copper resistance protein CopZ [Azoarcus communis] [Parazoarcus communis SWub3 = DSM 12120]